MKIIRPEFLLKHIDDQLALLSLVEDQKSIKIETLKASLMILKNMIKDSIEDYNNEK